MKTVKKKITIGDRELSLEYGKLAEQADCAVLARYGETMVLTTIVSSAPREEIDYFPLFVEYIERLYAGGRIKGSRWVKREGRPSDEAILKARLIDRSIRPLFPETYKNEVQVVVTVLSVDGENDPGILSIIATSAALTASSIPWGGPVGAVRVGYVNKADVEDPASKFIINPTNQERELSDLDLVVSATKERVLMLEGGANEINEDIFINSLLQSQKETNKIVQLINDFAAEIKPTKQAIPPDNLAELTVRIEKEYRSDIEKLATSVANLDRETEKDMQNKLVEQIYSRFENEYTKKDIAKVIDKVRKKVVREKVLKEKKRVDGRKPEDLREIGCAIEILPRTHGSALFKRGATQALSVATLGSPSLEQWLESPAGEETKRYMHHYNMPPYSVGETGRFGWPSRREVGHGALAERALLPVIPSEEEFSYTIRVVSEIMSSNGSTSMAAVCGSTLALMDAGVPIKAPVAGISIGLVTDDEDKYVILTDILGLEDFTGDMDFKIAGTKKGITAIQLDVKIAGLTEKIVRETVEKARTTRLAILEKMEQTLPEPRDHVSKYAPKVERFAIPEDKIGEVIGPGGKMIRSIIARYNVDVDVDDENGEGQVTVSGLEKKNVDSAVEMIKGMTRELKVGEKFSGEVKRIVPFGAFVEIFPGREGLVHISRMSTSFVSDPRKIVTEGDKVEVKIFEIDEQDRINLTMVMDDSFTPSRRPPQRSTYTRTRPHSRQTRRSPTTSYPRLRPPPRR